MIDLNYNRFIDQLALKAAGAGVTIKAADCLRMSIGKWRRITELVLVLAFYLSMVLQTIHVDMK